MLFNVPQYIDVEDKIAGPLTAKQLGWMIVMVVVLLIMWAFLEKAVFFLVAIPTGLLFLALAFYRPYNQSMGAFFLSGVRFLFRPKVYVWKRTAESVSHYGGAEEEPKKKIPEKKASLEDIETLSKVVDTEGMENNQRMMEIIKERHKK